MAHNRFVSLGPVYGAVGSGLSFIADTQLFDYVMFVKITAPL